MSEDIYPVGYVATHRHPMDKRRNRYTPRSRRSAARHYKAWVMASESLEDFIAGLREVQEEMNEMAFQAFRFVSFTATSTTVADFALSPPQPASEEFEVELTAAPIEPDKTYAWLDPYPDHPALEADPHEGDLR